MRLARAAANDFVCSPDFAMVDQAFLALVNEFDRIFDRDDVILARLVRVVDDCGQRRGLSAACRAGYQDEALMQASRISS